MNKFPSFVRTFIAGAALIGAAGVATPATAQSNDSAKLKAAIVLNILRFVEFPSSQGDITFCVSTSDPAVSSFQALSGRTAGARPVSVRTLRSSSYSGCDVVYLGETSSAQIEKASANGRVVIGDGSRFIGRGGTVGLVRTGGQIRFELNLRKADESNIGFSSRLIRLASRISR